MKRLLGLLLLVVLFVSCNSSQRAYNDLVSFTDYLEENSASFSTEDWDNARLEYSAIIENIDSQVYSNDELIEIGKLKGRCAVQFAKSTIKNAGKELNKFLLEAEGVIQSFIEEFTKEDTDSYE